MIRSRNVLVTLSILAACSSTTSDFVVVDLKSGGTLLNPSLESVSPEAEGVTASGNRLVVGQPIDRASSGGQVELVLDVELSGVVPGVPPHIELESGAIGRSTVHLFTYVQDTLVEVTTMKLGGTFKAFDVPSELFVAPSA